MGMSLIKSVKKNYEASTVLGVDASTNSFAFCLYDATGPVKWGEIKYKGSTVFERLAYAQRNVSAMRDYLKADLIVFEGAIFVQNKKTVILLAYAFGCVVSALLGDGSKVEEISPLAWQNFIGNKTLTKAEKDKIAKEHPGKSKSWYSEKGRQMRKQRTMDWAKQEFGISVDSDNVSDAICIAHYGYHTFGKGA